MTTGETSEVTSVRWTDGEGRLAAVIRTWGAGMWAYAQSLAGERAREALEAATAAARMEIEQGGSRHDARSALLRHVRRQVAVRMPVSGEAGCPAPLDLVAVRIPGQLAWAGRQRIGEHVGSCSRCTLLAGKLRAADRLLTVRPTAPAPSWLYWALLATDSGKHQATSENGGSAWAAAPASGADATQARAVAATAPAVAAAPSSAPAAAPRLAVGASARALAIALVALVGAAARRIVGLTAGALRAPLRAARLCGGLLRRLGAALLRGMRAVVVGGAGLVAAAARWRASVRLPRLRVPSLRVPRLVLPRAARVAAAGVAALAIIGFVLSNVVSRNGPRPAAADGRAHAVPALTAPKGPDLSGVTAARVDAQALAGAARARQNRDVRARRRAAAVARARRRAVARRRAAARRRAVARRRAAARRPAAPPAVVTPGAATPVVVAPRPRTPAPVSRPRPARPRPRPVRRQPPKQQPPSDPGGRRPVQEEP